MSRMDLQLRWLAVILFLLFIGECKSTKRIQRRFMWKEVDHTMDGIFDSMASSARAMKSMFGDLIPGMTTPSTHSLMHGNILDYLPSETTKVKYIIRTPTTKPMKILKMSAPKKVVKIMSAVPVKPIAVEVKQQHHNKPKYNFGNTAAAFRQMEKEQELIAEGRFPGQQQQQHNDEDNNKKNNNDIISGKIHEFNSDWQPIASTVQSNSYPMSQLYTDVLSEKLPQPERQIYNPTNEIGDTYEETKRKNSYEVTEHSPEESVAIPYTQHYHNTRGFIPIRSSVHTARSALPIRTPTPTTATQKTTTTSRTTTTTSSSTTEAPNYPASFLKKMRERPVNFMIKPSKSPSPEVVNWVRSSNASILNAKLFVPKQQQPIIRSPSSSWSVVMGPTLLPSMLELSSTQPKLRNPEALKQSKSDERTSERLRANPTKVTSTVKPRDIRQRGSIKFGDRLEESF